MSAFGPHQATFEYSVSEVVPPLQRVRTLKQDALAVAAAPFFLEAGEAEPVGVEEVEAHADAAGLEVVEVAVCREISEAEAKSTDRPRRLIPDAVEEKASMEALVAVDDSAGEVADFVEVVALP
jgi:hypothetical protein